VNRAKVFQAVLDALDGHCGLIPLNPKLHALRHQWEHAPWNLPAVVPVDKEETCILSTVTLKFVGSSYKNRGAHLSRESTINAAREWWTEDQKTWPEQKEAAEKVAAGEPKVTVDGTSGEIIFKLPPLLSQEFARLGLTEPTAPAPKKLAKPKGVLTVAKATLGARAKKNFIAGAKRTAAAKVKEAALVPTVALLKSSENPLALAAADLLATPHGDAAIGGIVSVIAMLALPEKFPGKEYVDQLLDEMQTAVAAHVTETAYDSVAAPLVQGVTGALMAYGAKMAALEGAKAALGAGSEG